MYSVLFQIIDLPSQTFTSYDSSYSGHTFFPLPSSRKTVILHVNSMEIA